MQSKLILLCTLDIVHPLCAPTLCHHHNVTFVSNCLMNFIYLSPIIALQWQRCMISIKMMMVLFIWLIVERIAWVVADVMSAYYTPGSNNIPCF